MKFQTCRILTWGACTAGALLAMQSPAHAMGKARTVAVGERTVQIASDIPKGQSDILVADLGRVSALNFAEANPEMLRVMGLEKADSSSLSHWLGERVGFVISEKMDIEKAVALVRKDVTYPYASEHPDLEESSYFRSLGLGSHLWNRSSGVKEVRGTTVMTNIGAALYLFGKERNMLLGVKVPGVGTIAMTSPRVGVVQIGEGLMSENLVILDGAKKDSQAHFGMRVSTYFHEARHSDGHGKSLSFTHAICPAGHDFEGINACDRNLNGPYTVGAYMIKSIAENCGTSCTTRDVELLSALTADSFDRVIRFTPGSDTQKGSQREFYLQMLNLCRQLSELGMSNAEGCSAADLEGYRRGLDGVGSDVPGVKSTDWDPAPESLSE